MNPGVFIGAGVLITTVIVLAMVVREARRLRRTRPLQFRNAPVRDAAPQPVMHDLPPEPAPAPPEPAPAPPVPKPAANVQTSADDFAPPTRPRGVDEKGRPKW
jgi:hypothetical protein